MKITKYEHACVVIQEKGKKLVIDPGSLTKDFGGVENVIAVVVTHEHADHFNPEHLQAIATANPEALLFTTEEVKAKFDGFKGHTFAPKAYDDFNVFGIFDLRFFGEVHAEIHESAPRPQNIGVLVNEKFYYPGDSFTPPDKDFDILAVPASAPWLKISEAMGFITEASPKQCFPTHNSLLSETGKTIFYNWLEQATKNIDAKFSVLNPGESIEIN